MDLVAEPPDPYHKRSACSADGGEAAGPGRVQRGVAAADSELSVIEMGGAGAETQETRATEASVRGLWKAYRKHMDL